MLHSTQWWLLAVVAPLSSVRIMDQRMKMTLLAQGGGLMPMPLAKELPFLRWCIRVWLCNQKSLNTYFNRIFLLIHMRMTKTLIWISLLSHQIVLVERLELLGSSRQKLGLDQQATERHTWPEMPFHSLRLMVIRSSANSACKLLILSNILKKLNDY